jgi:hypothetical protein
MPRKILSKELKTPIGIDIIYNHCTAWSQDCPGSIKLETYVTCTMQAVMDEEIDLSESSQQHRKASSA